MRLSSRYGTPDLRGFPHSHALTRPTE
jgi:hypothetical protein